MSQDKQQSVVIGGGVIGAMCAWYLSKSGHAVTIIDSGKFGNACSHGNCGYVCPSHVLPLTTPGAIPKALKSFFNPDSPFLIRPRLSLDLWRWLLNFASRCNRDSMLDAAITRDHLLKSSMRLYEELIDQESLEVEWQRRGLLFVFQTRTAFEHYAETDQLLRDKFSVAATPYTGDQVNRLEPALKPGLAGAWHYPSDCHLRPDHLMTQMKDKLIKRGVRIVEDAAVERFVHSAGWADAVQTSAGSIEGKNFVVATGALTPFLNQHLGVNIPIQPGKGYSITTTRPAVVPRIPLIFEEHSVAVTPFAEGYRIGSTMEFAGYDRSMNPRRLEILRRGAKIYLDHPYTQQVQETWFGWRPMTWDGKPYIDQTPLMRNTWVAAGHNMLGLSMATGTGKLISEMINRETPHLNPRPLSLSRIQRW